MSEDIFEQNSDYAESVIISDGRKSHYEETLGRNAYLEFDWLLHERLKCYKDLIGAALLTVGRNLWGPWVEMKISLRIWKSLNRSKWVIRPLFRGKSGLTNSDVSYIFVRRLMDWNRRDREPNTPGWQSLEKRWRSI